MNEPVVLGYDGSPCSAAALDEALAYAQGLGDGDIIVVYCREPPAGLSCDLDPTCEAAKTLRDWECDVRQQIAPMMSDAAQRIAAAGLKSELCFQCGDPVRRLAEIAAERGARAIVVGSHGEGWLAATLHRCTPLELLRHSSVPVLVVPFKG